MNMVDTESLFAFKQQVSNTKYKKLHHLIQKTEHKSQIIDRPIDGFFNASKVSISDDTKKILDLGPSFVMPNTKLTDKAILELQADLELCVKELKVMKAPKESIEEFSGGMTKLIKASQHDCNQKQRSLNTKKFEEEIRQLSKSTTIVPTDKTRRLIALNNHDYITMHEEAIIGSQNFSKTKHLQPSTRQAYFNRAITSISRKYKFNHFKTWLWLNESKCSDPTTSSSYILPKDHKPGTLKGRPIVAATDGPGTFLARRLSYCLNKLLFYVEAHLKNTDSFLSWLKRIDVSDLGGFASLDVTNLYGSIPRHDSETELGVYSILEKFISLYKDKDATFNILHTKDIMELIKLALENDYIIHKGDVYKQINGLSMGNPLAPQVAIIYMDSIENKILESFPINMRPQWKRYIDDVFLIWPRSNNLQAILNKCNMVSKYIKFTSETPNDDGLLPYLDCEIYLKNNQFQSRLYMKPIHSGCIHPWLSNGPISQKRSIVIGEYNRATKRSFSVTDKVRSIEKVKERFMRNGYPEEFLNTTLNLFYKQQKSKRQDGLEEHQQREKKQKKTYMRIPFTSEIMKRKMMALIRRTGLQDQVRLGFDIGTSLKRKFHPPKEKPLCSSACETCMSSSRTNQCMTKNVIYKITCQKCNKIYIGETKRMVGRRIQEHQSDDNSAVKQHMAEKHQGEGKIRWEILHRNSYHERKRLIMESKYIQGIPTANLINRDFLL